MEDFYGRSHSVSEPNPHNLKKTVISMIQK